jgi:hypothetical protein
MTTIELKVPGNKLFWYILIALLIIAVVSGPSLYDKYGAWQQQRKIDALTKQVENDATVFANRHFTAPCFDSKILPIGEGGLPAGTRFDLGWETLGWVDYRSNDGNPNKPLHVEMTWTSIDGDTSGLVVKWQNGETSIESISGNLRDE